MAKALEEMGYDKGANAINRWRLAEWEVLHQICVAHGIEISEPKKSRGYSFTTQEYGEHKDEIRRLEKEKAQVSVELEKIAKKKVKIDEIEGIETKESMFGKKVTLSKTDYDTLNDTAKKYVAMVKSTKKLKAEYDTAVQERDALKKQLSAVSSELASYKKKEEDARYFSRDKLKAEVKRISRENEFSCELKKAKAFIATYGLSDEFSQFKFNKARGSELE